MPAGPALLILSFGFWMISCSFFLRVPGFPLVVLSLILALWRWTLLVSFILPSNRILCLPSGLPFQYDFFRVSSAVLRAWIPSFFFYIPCRTVVSLLRSRKNIFTCASPVSTLCNGLWPLACAGTRLPPTAEIESTPFRRLFSPNLCEATFQLCAPSKSRFVNS